MKKNTDNKKKIPSASFTAPLGVLFFFIGGIFVFADEITSFVIFILLGVLLFFANNIITKIKLLYKKNIKGKNYTATVSKTKVPSLDLLVQYLLQFRLFQMTQNNVKKHYYSTHCVQVY